MLRLTTSVAAVLAITLGASAQLNSPAALPRTVLDGVFTQTQAARGKAAYERQCQGCHGANFEGSGVSRPLRTQVFLDVWREDYLGNLYQYMLRTMPVDDPGSLPASAYLDTLAYILKGNGFPSGNSELTTDSLGKILLVGLQGPQPLPPNVLIRVTGCLESRGDSWVLARASDPKRIRATDKTTAEELGRSGTLAFGTATYPLTQISEQSASLGGERVQVKGMLSASGAVRVDSLDPTGVSCQK